VVAPAPGPGYAAPAAIAGAALRFQTLAEIASGDTARIDLCRATEPAAVRGRLVAVKRLHAHLLEDRELASMFFDEVWMTASLVHPNVVETVGWGDDEEGPFLAVELVEGVSLARLTKTVFDTGEIFGERMVVYVGSQICRGLAAAHDLRGPDGELLGLVHRDLTPGNVLVGFEGRVKITDFGLAKAKQRITRTVTGLLKGRPQYMAPEQARGDAVDLRADLFSLGVVLFELFAGRRPWSGATEFEVLSTTQNDPPADLRELRPKIDRELASIVMRLLEKAPDDRFASASEVGIRLDEWLAVHGWSEGNEEALARFVRRNAMRQMRWFERAVQGELPVPRRRARPAAAPSTSAADVRPSRRERARRAFDDATEVSSAAAVASRLDHPDRHDTPLAMPSSVGVDLVGPDPALGEEIPTLIQSERPLTPSAPAAPSVRHGVVGALAPPAAYSIAEEDSDGRTTAVKTRSPTAPPVPEPPFGASEPIEDPETETIPVKGPRQQAVKAAIEAARSAPLPPPRPPPRPGGAASSQPPASPLRSSPPPAVEPLVGPQASAPPAMAWTVEAVADAADRIARLARAAEDDARAAATEAALRAAVARALAEASATAQASLAAASGGDLIYAARAMEEADRIASAAQRGEVDVAPEAGRASFAPPDPEPPRSEPAPAFPPVVPFASTPPYSLHEVRPVNEPAPGGGPGGGSSLEATALALRFRPLLLGLPPSAAVAIVVLALLALLLLVLVVTG
jgi:serine/threonine-protein kinase